MTAGDLIVKDSEYEDYATAIQAFADRIEDRAATYLDTMMMVNYEAIMEGQTAENLDNYRSAFKNVQGISAIVALELANNMKHYVADIDKKDEYLY